MDQDAYQKRIAEIRQRFVERLDGPLATLKETLSGPCDNDGLIRMRAILHEWAGTAPTLGLHAFGAQARDLESVIADALASGRCLGETEVGRLTAGFEELAAQAEEARETNG